jgi:hypothetical protein
MMGTSFAGAAGDNTIVAPVIVDYNLLTYKGVSYIYERPMYIPIIENGVVTDELYLRLYAARSEDPTTGQLVKVGYISIVSYRSSKTHFAFIIEDANGLVGIIDSDCDGVWEPLDVDGSPYIPKCVMERDGGS